MTFTPDQTRNQWHREAGQQVSLSYDLPVGLSVGYSYGETQFKNDRKRQNAAGCYQVHQ